MARAVILAVIYLGLMLTACRALSYVNITSDEWDIDSGAKPDTIMTLCMRITPAMAAKCVLENSPHATLHCNVATIEVYVEGGTILAAYQVVGTGQWGGETFEASGASQVLAQLWEITRDTALHYGAWVGPKGALVLHDRSLKAMVMGGILAHSTVPFTSSVLEGMARHGTTYHSGKEGFKDMNGAELCPPGLGGEAKLICCFADKFINRSYARSYWRAMFKSNLGKWWLRRGAAFIKAQRKNVSSPPLLQGGSSSCGGHGNDRRGSDDHIYRTAARVQEVATVTEHDNGVSSAATVSKECEAPAVLKMAALEAEPHEQAAVATETCVVLETAEATPAGNDAETAEGSASVKPVRLDSEIINKLKARHSQEPFPDLAKKRQIAAELHITLDQVTRWFRKVNKKLNPQAKEGNGAKVPGSPEDQKPGMPNPVQGPGGASVVAQAAASVAAPAGEGKLVQSEAAIREAVAAELLRALASGTLDPSKGADTLALVQALIKGQALTPGGEASATVAAAATTAAITAAKPPELSPEEVERARVEAERVRQQKEAEEEEARREREEKERLRLEREAEKEKQRALREAERLEREAKRAQKEAERKEREAVEQRKQEAKKKQASFMMSFLGKKVPPTPTPTTTTTTITTIIVDDETGHVGSAAATTTTTAAAAASNPAMAAATASPAVTPGTSAAVPVDLTSGPGILVTTACAGAPAPAAIGLDATLAPERPALNPATSLVDPAAPAVQTVTSARDAPTVRAAVGVPGVGGTALGSVAATPTPPHAKVAPLFLPPPEEVMAAARAVMLPPPSADSMRALDMLLECAGSVGGREGAAEAETGGKDAGPAKLVDERQLREELLRSMRDLCRATTMVQAEAPLGDGAQTQASKEGGGDTMRGSSLPGGALAGVTVGTEVKSLAVPAKTLKRKPAQHWGIRRAVPFAHHNPGDRLRKGGLAGVAGPSSASPAARTKEGSGGGKKRDKEGVVVVAAGGGGSAATPGRGVATGSGSATVPIPIDLDDEGDEVDDEDDDDDVINIGSLDGIMDAVTGSGGGAKRGREEDGGGGAGGADAGRARKRMKLLQFSENVRPAYYGTFSKSSKHVTGRKPLGRDPEMDYDFDSEAEWEEEEPGESLSDAEDMEEEEEGAEDEEDGFLVPDGYLSDDEVAGGIKGLEDDMADLDDEEDENGAGATPNKDAALDAAAATTANDPAGTTDRTAEAGPEEHKDNSGASGAVMLAQYKKSDKARRTFDNIAERFQKLNVPLVLSFLDHPAVASHTEKLRAEAGPGEGVPGARGAGGAAASKDKGDGSGTAAPSLAGCGGNGYKAVGSGTEKLNAIMYDKREHLLSVFAMEVVPVAAPAAATGHGKSRRCWAPEEVVITPPTAEELSYSGGCGGREGGDAEGGGRGGSPEPGGDAGNNAGGPRSFLKVFPEELVPALARYLHANVTSLEKRVDGFIAHVGVLGEPGSGAPQLSKRLVKSKLLELCELLGRGRIIQLREEFVVKYVLSAGISEGPPSHPAPALRQATPEPSFVPPCLHEPSPSMAVTGAASTVTAATTSALAQSPKKQHTIEWLFQKKQQHPSAAPSVPAACATPECAAPSAACSADTAPTGSPMLCESSAAPTEASHHMPQPVCESKPPVAQAETATHSAVVQRVESGSMIREPSPAVNARTSAVPSKPMPLGDLTNIVGRQRGPACMSQSLPANLAPAESAAMTVKADVPMDAAFDAPMERSLPCSVVDVVDLTSHMPLGTLVADKAAHDLGGVADVAMADAPPLAPVTATRECPAVASELHL
eukprot:jgi/Mesvir1/11808/Mv00165-RA.1